MSESPKTHQDELAAEIKLAERIVETCHGVDLAIVIPAAILSLITFVAMALDGPAPDISEDTKAAVKDIHDLEHKLFVRLQKRRMN